MASAGDEVYASCPTDVVAAPVEVVWSLLMDTPRWGDFFDLRDVVADPPGRAAVGQSVTGHSGPRAFRFVVAFQIVMIDETAHRLCARVDMPFGLRVDEDLDVTPLPNRQCRIRYHCNFTLPSGLRGRVLKMLLGKELVDGPLDSLARLKRAAEARHKEAIS
jgi:hypothetical protein